MVHMYKILSLFLLLISSLKVNAKEIEYVGLNSHNSQISMRGDYKGERVIGLGEGTNKYTSEKLAFRADKHDSMKYLLQRDVAERDLMAYAKVTFGPLSSYLPIQTNSTVEVHILKITAIKSFELVQFGNLYVTGGLGGALQELKINVVTESPKAIEGYLITPATSLLLNLKGINQFNFFSEYARGQGVAMRGIGNKYEEGVVGVKYKINKTIGFGVHFFHKRELISFEDHSKSVQYRSRSKGAAFSTSLEF